MTAKAFLVQIRTITARLKSVARQIQTLDDMLTEITPQLSDSPPSALPNIRRAEKLIAAKVDLERKLDADSARLAEITRTINTLPDPLHSMILVSRYIALKDWRDIANEFHNSMSHMFRLHSAALLELDRLVAHESEWE